MYLLVHKMSWAPSSGFKEQKILFSHETLPSTNASQANHESYKSGACSVHIPTSERLAEPKLRTTGLKQAGNVL